MSFNLSAHEESTLTRFSKDERAVDRFQDLLVEHEDDIDGLEAALREDSGSSKAYGFDPTIILLLIKLAPLLWTLIKSWPDIIEFWRHLRSKRQQKRRERRGDDVDE